MPLYESTFIARHDMSTQQVEALAEDLSTILKDNGGEVAKTEFWGPRTLAYRIKKNRKGHYVFFNLDAPSDAVQEYERNMRLNEDVLRYMTVRVDELDPNPSAMMQSRSARDDRSHRGGPGRDGGGGAAPAGGKVETAKATPAEAADTVEAKATPAKAADAVEAKASPAKAADAVEAKATPAKAADAVEAKASPAKAADAVEAKASPAKAESEAAETKKASTAETKKASAAETKKASAAETKKASAAETKKASAAETKKAKPKAKSKAKKSDDEAADAGASADEDGETS